MSTAYRLLKHTSPSPGWGRDKGWGFQFLLYRLLKHTSPSPGWGRDKGWGLQFLLYRLLKHITPSPGWGRDKGWGLLLFIFLMLSSCTMRPKNGYSKDGQLQGRVTLSGAFALYPLAVEWGEEFQKLHPDVRVDISAGGAGKGITDALAGAVDLGMVSRDLEPEEVKKGAVGFVVAKDAVVPTVNIHNPNIKAILAHGLTREAAIAMWVSGKEKTWGEVCGNRCIAPVNVYSRSDACGAAGTWAKWLDNKQEDLKGTAVYGDPGVVQAIQKDINGIGFSNIGFVYDIKTRRPNAGIVVIPIDLNGNGKIDPDERFYDTLTDLSKAIASGKYPTPPARNLYLVTHGQPKDPVVKEFLKFVLTKGQKAAPKNGFVASPQPPLSVPPLSGAGNPVGRK